MKQSRILALALTLALCLSARAGVFQTKNLSTAGSSVILIPGGQAHIIVIQNNGSNSVRLSLDGGAGYLDPVTGKYGTNPTPTTGYLLAAGHQLTIWTPAMGSGGPTNDPGTHKPIVAIMVSSTTTLDITTDDTGSSDPTT